jgi:hypothetical protein
MNLIRCMHIFSIRYDRVRPLRFCIEEEAFSVQPDGYWPFPIVEIERSTLHQGLFQESIDSHVWGLKDEY